MLVTEPATFTLSMLEEKLRTLSGHTFRMVRGGDGAAGHTLEHLLGLRENNLCVPDWGEFELKTCRMDSTTPVTLLSKSPKRTGDISRHDFLAKHGYTDTMGRTGLNCTVSSLCVNSRGWQLRAALDDQHIDFEHLGEVVAYQDLPSLTRNLARKVRNIVLVMVDILHDESGLSVQYAGAYLLAGIHEEEIASLIRQGQITFDWRMYVKPDGSVRDHGPVYRIQEANIPQLYSTRRRIL